MNKPEHHLLKGANILIKKERTAHLINKHAIRVLTKRDHSIFLIGVL